MKHIVKASVYGFRVPRYQCVLNSQRILVSHRQVLYNAFSEKWRVVHLKILVMLETTGAKAEKDIPAPPYE